MIDSKEFLRIIKREQLLNTLIVIFIISLGAPLLVAEPPLGVLTFIFYLPVVILGIFLKFKRALIFYFPLLVLYGLSFYYFYLVEGLPPFKISLLFGLNGIGFFLVGYMLWRLRALIFKEYKKIREKAIFDSLTKAFSRDFFEEMLDHQLKEAKRMKSEFSLLMLDLDWLKKYNDKLGHPAVDNLLSQFVDLLKKMVRKSDFVCRWGGDEFMIILPHTSDENAYALAKRIRQGLLKAKFSIKGQEITSLSASIGIASYPNFYTKEMLIEKVDEALYNAKRTKERIYKI